MPVDGDVIYVNRTEDTSIICSARGIPPPSIRFLQGDQELNRTGGESGAGLDLASRVQLGNDLSSLFMGDGTFIVSRMLTIFNVAEEDTGNFSCEAFSTILELSLSLNDSSVFQLIVQSELKPALKLCFWSSPIMYCNCVQWMVLIATLTVSMFQLFELMIFCVHPPSFQL